MKLQLCCYALSAALLSACGQAGPLVLPDKNGSTPPPATTPAQVVPALPGMDTPPTETPAATQQPKKEQP